MGNASVITFYSYKGGVGRSMALANIGVLLAKWGKKTLVIDWDLEAPGLENYFSNFIQDFDSIVQKEGLIDILYNRTVDPAYEVNSIDWNTYISPINFENNTNLQLLTAGQKDEGYIGKVRNFDFSDFYSKHDGGDFLEDMRTWWKNNFDFILIDSRTGLTDSSGVCSIQMPDVIVLMFTATVQGFKGTLNVVKKAKKGQEQLIYDRLKLKALPVPTRFDNAELKLTEEWLNKFATDLKDVYEDFIPLDPNKEFTIQPIDILKKTKIPYISFFSYGEKLPVLEQGSDDPNSLGYAYETISAILANNFKNIQRLKDERDIFIKSAKGEAVTDYTYYERKLAEERQERIKLQEQLAAVNEQLQQTNQLSRNNLSNTNKNLFIIIGSILLVILITFLVIRSSSSSSSSESPTGEKMADSTSYYSDSTKMDSSTKKMDSPTKKMDSSTKK